MDLRKFLNEFYVYTTSPTVDIRTGRQAERLPPAYIADQEDWVDRLSSGKIIGRHFLYATTLSVLTPEKESVSCHILVIELDGYAYIDQNCTLRFERAVAPRLCGLSRDFLLEEELEDGEFELYEGIENDKPIELTEQMEREILRQIGRSLQVQFSDPMFKDVLTNEQKAEVTKIFDI